MTSIADLFVEVRGDTRRLEGDVIRGGTRAATGFGSRFKSVLKGALGVAGVGGGVSAALGLAKFAKDSVGLEAQFSKTMNVLQATTDAPKADMRELSRLALKMGADTTFSANDASQAMLELARGGLNAAQIQAGALKGTLTLAAAGELSMGDAANAAVKSMGQFNLKGRDMGKIAAALAGGANASSASVSDMTQALAQGGLAANSVGFSIQETTALLAAFSNAGLEGSDAGTSLKTMLDRLQPSTDGAATAMEKLGVITDDGRNRFLKANGEFRSAASIAEVLKKGTVDLTAAEKKRLITQAFGSDAQRAATIFAKEGAQGLKDLEKQTSDTSAAQKMAGANMKGTAGALEQLSGSVETAELKFGKGLAPTVRQTSRDLAHFLNEAPLQKWGRESGHAIGSVIGVVKSEGPVVLDWFRDMKPLAHVTLDVLKTAAPYAQDLVDAVKDMPEWAQKALVGGVAGAAIGKKLGAFSLLGGSGGRGGLAGLIGSAKPLPVFVTNPGFGAGGVGVPGLPGKGAPGKLPKAPLPLPLALPALGSQVINKPYVEFTGNLKAANAELATFAMQRTGIKDIDGAFRSLDSTYAKLARSNPTAGLDKFKVLAGQTHTSLDDLREILPRTSKALGDVGGSGATKAAHGVSIIDRSVGMLRQSMLDLPRLDVDNSRAIVKSMKTLDYFGQIKKQHPKPPIDADNSGAISSSKDVLKQLGIVDKQHPMPKIGADATGARSTIRSLMGDLNSLVSHPWSIFVNTERHTTFTSSGGQPKPPRATGGPVEPGREYRVNELRQEFFTPSRRGYVQPLDKAGGNSIDRLVAAFERSRGSRVEFVITNWETGTGYMRDIANGEIDADHEYRDTLSRQGLH